VVNEGAIVTPPEGPWILPGITRELALELARDAGFSCAEVPVSEHALKSADEVWLTSSTLELVPVVSVDGLRVGTGRPGPVWERLQALYRNYTVSVMSA
jgi:D-alanine transaminase